MYVTCSSEQNKSIFEYFFALELFHRSEERSNINNELCKEKDRRNWRTDKVSGKSEHDFLCACSHQLLLIDFKFLNIGIDDFINAEWAHNTTSFKSQ